MLKFYFIICSKYVLDLFPLNLMEYSDYFSKRHYHEDTFGILTNSDLILIDSNYYLPNKKFFTYQIFEIKNN